MCADPWRTQLRALQCRTASRRRCVRQSLPASCTRALEAGRRAPASGWQRLQAAETCPCRLERSGARRSADRAAPKRRHCKPRPWRRATRATRSGASWPPWAAPRGCPSLSPHYPLGTASTETASAEALSWLPVSWTRCGRRCIRTWRSSSRTGSRACVPLARLGCHHASSHCGRRTAGLGTLCHGCAFLRALGRRCSRWRCLQERRDPTAVSACLLQRCSTRAASRSGKETPSVGILQGGLACVCRRRRVHRQHLPPTALASGWFCPVPGRRMVLQVAKQTTGLHLSLETPLARRQLWCCFLCKHRRTHFAPLQWPSARRVVSALALCHCRARAATEQSEWRWHSKRMGTRCLHLPPAGGMWHRGCRRTWYAPSCGGGGAWMPAALALRTASWSSWLRPAPSASLGSSRKVQRVGRRGRRACGACRLPVPLGALPTWEDEARQRCGASRSGSAIEERRPAPGSCRCATARVRPSRPWRWMLGLPASPCRHRGLVPRRW
mmetsp:Transcript_109521/g.353462  ORF Transcript_109521/g.353462 Transcript_109521/m.353462 type:complete len:499 (-) Transcript_109521:469-1965(-)